MGLEARKHDISGAITDTNLKLESLEKGSGDWGNGVLFVWVKFPGIKARLGLERKMELNATVERMRLL